MNFETVFLLFCLSALFLFKPHLNRLGEDLGALIVAPSLDEYLKAPTTLMAAEIRIRRIWLVRILAWCFLRGKERKSWLKKLAKLRCETGEFVVVQLSHQLLAESLRLTDLAGYATRGKDTTGYSPISLAGPSAQDDLRRLGVLAKRIRREARNSGLSKNRQFSRSGESVMV